MREWEVAIKFNTYWIFGQMIEPFWNVHTPSFSTFNIRHPRELWPRDQLSRNHLQLNKPHTYLSIKDCISCSINSTCSSPTRTLNSLVSQGNRRWVLAGLFRKNEAAANNKHIKLSQQWCELASLNNNNALTDIPNSDSPGVCGLNGSCPQAGGIHSSIGKQSNF